MARLSSRQRAALAKLNEADFVSFTGHSAGAAYKLQKLGLAEYVGPDRWMGSIYCITPAGRQALQENTP